MTPWHQDTLQLGSILTLGIIGNQYQEEQFDWSSVTDSQLETIADTAIEFIRKKFHHSEIDKAILIKQMEHCLMVADFSYAVSTIGCTATVDTSQQGALYDIEEMCDMLKESGAEIDFNLDMLKYQFNDQFVA